MYILDVTILYDYIVRFGEKIKILFLNQFLRPKKIICVLPIDPKILPPTLTFFMPKKKKIDRQNPEIRLRFRFQQFSSFPCTFDRCLEPKTLYCMSNN